MTARNGCSVTLVLALLGAGCTELVDDEAPSSGLLAGSPLQPCSVNTFGDFAGCLVRARSTPAGQHLDIVILRDIRLAPGESFALHDLVDVTLRGAGGPSGIGSVLIDEDLARATLLDADPPTDVKTVLAQGLQQALVSVSQCSVE